MPIQLIDADGSVNILTKEEVQAMVEALDNAIVTESLTVPPEETSEDFYTEMIALKTKLLPFV